MKPHNRVLVLMRDSSTPEESLFVADLYSGNHLEASVYLDREAMLQWITPIDPTAQTSVAQALSKLEYSAERSMYSIPVCQAQA